jgi:hypothetical protein
MHRFLVPLSLVLILIPRSSQATPVTAFLRHPETEQHVYALGAVSMLAFTEITNGHKARAQCITDWYNAKGEDQFFAGVNLAPQAFKARFGISRDDETIAHIEILLIRLANEACPK